MSESAMRVLSKQPSSARERFRCRWLLLYSSRMERSSRWSTRCRFMFVMARSVDDVGSGREDIATDTSDFQCQHGRQCFAVASF